MSLDAQVGSSAATGREPNEIESEIMAKYPPNRPHTRVGSRGIRGPRRGFTLVELMAVMIIIGIILAFILTAAMDSVRRAEERATQSLISKLENALNDRLDALLQIQPDPNPTHFLLANVYSSVNGVLAGTQRANVIATFDHIKRELPDVFFVQNKTPSSGGYPLNFAGNAFPVTNGSPLVPLPQANFVLPLGQGNLSTGEGIFGASYYAAAGIYKNLGYLPKGYDGVDNGGVFNLVDEWDEGVNDTNRAQVLANLAAHQHKTARSEMLYALLVEGNGPLGSAFSRDDFTDKEVMDTDGDGLPEFVDAWGEPLQFYRWPILYHSDIQRGQMIVSTSEQTQKLVSPYSYPWEEREQDPLDQNQQLVAPAWWYLTNPSGLILNDNFLNFTGLSFPTMPPKAAGMSDAAHAFEFYFHRLSEPLEIANSSTGFGQAWDRSNNYPRGFYSKFLIVSSGPDKQLGLFQYGDTTLHSLSNPVSGLIYNENSAMPFVFDFTANARIPAGGAVISSGASYDLQQNGMDDITNHGLQTSVGGG